MPRIVQIIEQAGDPAAVANSAIIYAKDVGGITQAFFRASDGALTQISSVPTGTFLNRQIFTASGTYTPTAGTRMVRVRMVGGGGGGGGITDPISSMGGGGASGAYWEKFIDPGALITGGAVTIGAAGAGGNDANGGTGGDTSVVIQAVTYTAKGGLGGGQNVWTAGPGNGGNGQGGSSAGDFVYQEEGQLGSYLDNTGGGITFWGGAGGSNPLGTGGGQQTDNANGNAGQGYGAGGGGSRDGIGNGGFVGGAGTAGVVIIDEYAQGAVPAGLFLGRQIFTASGTYTPTLTTKRVRVRMVGGGGGGGGGGGAGGPISGGGAGGAYFELTISPGALVTGGAVTIGAAGSGSGSGTGGTGGDSSVVIQGVTYTAKGGLGGLLNSNAGETIALGGGTQAGTSAGDVTFQCPGKYGIVNGASYFLGGGGGDSPLGAGGANTFSDTGNNGQGYGSGGSGAVDNGFGCVGGNGTAGLVIIEEYTG